MKLNKKRTILILIVSILLLSLQACAHPMFYRSKEFSGTVVDATTNEPIEGVVVVAQWIPRSWKVGEMGHYGLVDIYEAVTDKEGKYMIPGWGPKLREPGTYLDDGEPEISFFKKGYWYLHVANDGKGGNSSPRESVWNGRVIKLKKFVFGEEIKYNDAYGRPATRKATDEDLWGTLGFVDTQIFNVFKFNEAGGIPVKRVKHMAKEWSEAIKELKRYPYTHSLPVVIEKMLKEEFKNE